MIRTTVLSKGSSTEYSWIIRNLKSVLRRPSNGSNHVSRFQRALHVAVLGLPFSSSSLMIDLLMASSSLRVSFKASDVKNVFKSVRVLGLTLGPELDGAGFVAGGLFVGTHDDDDAIVLALVVYNNKDAFC